MGFFAGINYALSELSDRQYRLTDDYGDHIDFQSKSDLKQAIKEHFNNFTCPSCESKRVDGSGVIVKYGRVEFYKEVSSKGFFGGTKYRDELYKTIWRIHELGLAPGQKGGFLESDIAPGQIYCKAKGCGWKIIAPVYPKKSQITWYSINDIMQGKPFKQ